MNGVNQARADVAAMTGMRFVNLATSVATDLVEGPLGAITAPISSYNDESLKDLAENRIKEAGKGIVPCHKQPMTAAQFRPMKGTVEYKYKRASKDCVEGGCSFQEETRLVTGTFVLTPEPHGWGMGGEGTGTLDQKSGGGTKNAKCSTEGHSTLSGPMKITVEAGGAGGTGVVRLLVANNDTLEADQSYTSTCGVGGTRHDHWSNGSFGFNCEGDNLDMVNGGSGSAFIPADQGYGTCKIEVSPQ